MKRASISDLKARLSAYLGDVRRGRTVIVCDRTVPIARLAPLETRPERLPIRPPSRPVADLKKVQGVRPRRRIDVVRLLRDSRGQR